MTTFCWLPPERDLISVETDGVLTPILYPRILSRAGDRAPVDKGPPRELLQRGQNRVVADGEPHAQAELLAILGEIADAGLSPRPRGT